jgi:hypothetical protein
MAGSSLNLWSCGAERLTLANRFAKQTNSSTWVREWAKTPITWGAELGRKWFPEAANSSEYLVIL